MFSLPSVAVMRLQYRRQIAAANAACILLMAAEFRHCQQHFADFVTENPPRFCR